MMPTAHKSSTSNLLDDLNTSNIYSSTSISDSSLNGRNNNEPNNNQPSSKLSSLIDLNPDKLKEPTQSSNNSYQKNVLNDLKNNNIVDTIASDSVSIGQTSSKDLSKEQWKDLSKEQSKDHSKDQLKELSKEHSSECSLRKNSSNKDIKDESNLTSSLNQSLLSNDHITNGQSTGSTNRDSLLSQSSNSASDQKSKHKSFITNKNRDSSSSNGSLISNSNLAVNGNLLNQLTNQKEHERIVWRVSRSHQKRFKRRFPSIEPDEQLIDWYSCALIADILLQGYLYISENYFAFYSNIFGYKTHVLVKVQDVCEITKEKTAKIFPNAVGIHTKQNKFVFGSLLSRENTYKLLNDVRGSYVNLHNLNKATDQSEDDLLDGGTLKPLQTSKLTELKTSKELELESSFIESKHAKDDSLGRLSKLDTISNFSNFSNTLSRRHQRSNSLRQFSSNKDAKLEDQLQNQTSLLDSTKFYDPFIHKLSSFRSVLKFDLKGNSISIPEEILNDMFKMIEVMKMNLNEISQLKSKLN